MKVIIENPSGIFSDVVMKSVKSIEQQCNIQLLFGSLSHRSEPGYNFGGDIVYFYNITPEQAKVVKSSLVKNGLPENSISIEQ
jgi:hypothetical protein